MKAREEIQAAIEVLHQACKNHKVGFLGFAWTAEPPMLLRFGNDGMVGEDSTELLMQLDEMVAERIEIKNQSAN